MVQADTTEYELFIAAAHRMVTEFHTVFGIPVGVPLSGAPQWLVKSRDQLITEEFCELSSSMIGQDRSKVAREMADLVYVVVGTAVAFGIYIPANDNRVLLIRPLSICVSRSLCAINDRDDSMLPLHLADVILHIWSICGSVGIDILVAVTEVHRANMTKLRPTDASMGKAIKPDGYREPDMTLALR